MIYKICSLRFQNEVNITSLLTLCRSSSIQLLEKIALYQKDYGGLLNFELSDFMPYDNEKLFVNRPELVEENIITLGFVEQKALRTLNYIDINEIENYYYGTFDYLGASKKQFGTISTCDNKSVFTFNKGSGIYCVVGFEEKTINTTVAGFIEMIKDDIQNVVDIILMDMPENYLKMITKHGKKRLVLSSLNTRLPVSILNSICNESSYTISEQLFLNKKTCFINSGACISESGVKSYNSIVSEYSLPKCVSVSF